MRFAHDTILALHGAAALVNTMPGTGPGDSSTDTLTTTAELDAFVDQWRWTGGRRHDAAELAAVRDLRPRLREVWEADEGETVEIVNRLLVSGRALPQIVDHDGLGWHIHATAPEAPLATRMAVEAAMALVDLIRAGELDRLRVCAAEDCDDVVVDLSRNRSRRYCEGGCGNRANVAAYRARRASTPAG